MADLLENPMGLMGFEFVEFASPTANVLEPLFEKMGFSLVAKHRSKDVVLYRQGDINFIVNREPKSQAWYFAAEHGAAACSMAFRVRDSHKAYARALELGAQPIDIPTGPMELRLPAIKGIGGAPLYLIDRYEDGKSIYDIDFDFLPNADRHPKGHGFRLIDHLTHNVYKGRMAFWGAFYERIFNFREIRYFDIKGEYTGLTSRAMTAPDGLIRIPLNEESGKTGGQIEEFLMQFNGEGIQHIALLTDDLLASVDALQMAGIPLMTAPNDVYYEMLEERMPGHGEPIEQLQTRGILMDGSTANGEKRLLWTIVRAHFSDIGGATHGAYNPGATEIWQEGLRIPPLRVFTGQGTDQEKLDVILANVRGSEEREGDILAQMAATRSADERLQELFASYGAATVKAAIADIHDQSERQMREAIREIPDGEYVGEDFLDHGLTGAVAPGVPAGAEGEGEGHFSAWAWMAVMATVLTMSTTVQPRERSLTGLRRPWMTGPMATAPAERWTAL